MVTFNLSKLSKRSYFIGVYSSTMQIINFLLKYNNLRLALYVYEKCGYMSKLNF